MRPQPTWTHPSTITYHRTKTAVRHRIFSLVDDRISGRWIYRVTDEENNYLRFSRILTGNDDVTRSYRIVDKPRRADLIAPLLLCPNKLRSRNFLRSNEHQIRNPHTHTRLFVSFRTLYVMLYFTNCNRFSFLYIYRRLTFPFRLNICEEKVSRWWHESFSVARSAHVRILRACCNPSSGRTDDCCAPVSRSRPCLFAAKPVIFATSGLDKS